MISEIKMRIDQIRRGEVPEGYRKSKLGIVPYEWDEVPFSTLFTNTSNYTDDLNTYPLYSLTIEDGITPKTERYERSHLVKKENSYKIVRPNDYAYNPMNIRFGAVARHKGNKPVAVSGYYDIFTTVHQSDLAFMDSFLTCGAMITYYNKVSTGSLVEKQRVHFSDFLSFSLPLPPLKERKKIAEIIMLQDQAIELNDQIIRQLMLMKKACLRKMFPEHGNNVPEVRFPGFTNPWEQRKVGDLVKDHNAGIYISKENYGEGINVIGVGNIYDSDIFDGEIYRLGPVNDDKFLLEEGDLIYGESSLVPEGIARTVCVGKNGAGSAFAWHTRRVKLDKDLVDSHFATLELNYHSAIRKYLMSVSTQTALTGMTTDGYFSVTLILPSIEEQKKISGIFKYIDTLITLHQRKRDEEKQKKKALMQLLFSGIVRVTV